MSLRIAFQMDPIETVNIDKDSSFVLALEAQKRGYSLYHYGPKALSLEGNRLSARARPLNVRREHGRHFTLGEPENLDLAKDVDIILMRQDPPFDMAYITATHMLEHLAGKTLVLNDPAEVRNAPEKLLVTHFPDLMPPTLITSDKERILAFREKHRDLILKPLYGNGGAQIFHIDEHSDNLNALLEMFTLFYREPVIVQKYLPSVREGDKRIILIDGEPAGAITRIPPAGEARANLHAGATARKTTLTNRDIEICAAISPALKERRLVFTGIDVIGDYITEINVTSPTGLQEIANLDGLHLEEPLWDAFEAYYERMVN